MNLHKPAMAIAYNNEDNNPDHLDILQVFVRAQNQAMST